MMQPRELISYNRATKLVPAAVAPTRGAPPTPPGIMSLQLLSPKALPAVLGEAISPGVRAVTLINRSGLLIGCAGDTESSSALGAIVSNLWQSHEKCEGLGSLGCLLLECEHGRLAVCAVGTFILACCADESVPFGLLRAKIKALHAFLQPDLSQISG